MLPCNLSTVLGFGQIPPEQISSCNLLGLWVSCMNIHLQTESSPEVAAKYSSAGMEEKSAQRVSKGILAAAFQAKGAGHSLQPSPRVKWAPSAPSLLLARGRWKASKGTSFYNTLLNLKPTTNKVAFAKNHRDRKFQEKSSLSLLVQRKENLPYIITRPGVIRHICFLMDTFLLGKMFIDQSKQNHLRCLSVGKDKHMQYSFC